MTDQPKLSAEAMRLRDLCDRATPGPWSFVIDDEALGIGGRVVANGRVIARCNTRFDGHDKPDPDIDDAKFIARAREIVPALLAELAQLGEQARAGLAAQQDAEEQRRRGNRLFGDLSELRELIEKQHNGYNDTGRLLGMQRPETHAQALRELLTEERTLANAEIPAELTAARADQNAVAVRELEGFWRDIDSEAVHVDGLGFVAKLSAIARWHTRRLAALAPQAKEPSK